MPAKDSPKTEQQGYQPPESGRPSDMDRVLTTLDRVFARFGDRLQTETPRRFTGNAEIAVGVFNDIVAGLKLEAAPVAVTLAARIVSATEVELTWTDVAGNADGYRVERCQGYRCHNLEEIDRLPSTARFFRDANVAPNTSYRYQLIAFNVRGEAGSNIVDITPASPQG
jgi:hypothetical protein